MSYRTFSTASHIAASALTFREDLALRAIQFVIGFAPIAALSLSTFNLIPLHLSGPLVVLPAMLLGVALAIRFPEVRRRMVTGLLLGVTAVTLYDMTRLPFVAAGLWPDFIPKIGRYLLAREDAHWSIGYLWRYLGNGGGMGMAFYAALPLVGNRWNARRVGVAYGIGIYCCLLATIYLSPSGKTYLFTPCLLSASVGLLGHVVFGFALGVGSAMFPDRSVQQGPSLTERVWLFFRGTHPASPLVSTPQAA